MCLAVIGQIKEINCNFAEVDFKGVSVKVNIELVDAAVRDYVMVHAGFAIQKVEKEEAEEILKLL